MNAAAVRPATLAQLSLSILAGCGGGGISSTPPTAQTPPPAPTLTHYAVIDLPPLPGATASQAQGLNSAGDVVGYSVVNGHATAVLWENGGPTDLGIPNSFANAVNSADQVAGYSLAVQAHHTPPCGSRKASLILGRFPVWTAA